MTPSLTGPSRRPRRRGAPLRLLSLTLGFALLLAPGCAERDAAPGADAAAPPGASGPLPVEEPGEECDPLGFALSATQPAGALDERSAILVDGRIVAPEGDVIVVGGNPSDLVLSPDGALAYVIRQGNGLLVVDLATAQVLQTVAAVRGYHGVALSHDGATVWAATMYGTLHRLAVGADGTLTENGSATLRGFLVDVATRPGSDLVYAVANTNGNIYEIDPATLETVRTLRAGRNPYALAFDDAGTLLFTSNVSSNTVSIIDVATGDILAHVPVCENPMGLAHGGPSGRLYVACSNSDLVGVIDAAAQTMVATIDLTGDPDQLTGAAVNELAFDAAAGRLYASAARRNRVDVVRVADGVLEGSLATGHYPTALALTPDGATLVAVATKGLGSQNSLWDIRGQLNVIAVPQTPEALALATARVAENNRRPSLSFPDTCGPTALPPALAGGEDRPIQHVVLIVRENKTYDVLLGDLEGANGDPALVLFGEEYTPNLHALARQFVNMDNFYADAEHSLQGHQWTTQADCNDFTEKIRRFQPPIEGFDPAATAGGGSIFEHCYANGVSFRNYGEVVGFGGHMFDELEPFVDHKYPFFNLKIADVEKAAEFIRELEAGVFPEFVYIVLPNDHTSGTTPGQPTPRWYVADNDAGTGLIIEAISQSPFWPETAVFVIEDDPQGPGDHVHAHRSICVVASPHVRRGYNTSVQYSTASLYATIERILELPPINANTRQAAPMIDIFVTGAPGDEPDFTPYTALPNPLPYEENTPAAPMAAESMAIDFTKIDEAPGLGLILWRAMRGDEPIPAYARYIDE